MGRAAEAEAVSAVSDTYTLKLVDKILEPLKRIEAAAERVGGVMERLEKMAGGGLGFLKLAGAAGIAYAGLKGMGGVLEGVLHLMEKGAHGAWELGKSFVEAARFAGASKRSFDIFLGEGMGEKAFAGALRFGNVLPQDERDVVKTAQALAGSGYSGKRLEAANAALADIDALRGSQYSQNLLLHFQRLQNEARPQARDVNMAAIDAGTGLGGIFKQIYKQMGKALPSDPDSEHGLHQMTKQYEEWVKEGKVGGRSVANAIMFAIEERFDKGEGLGAAAKKLGLGTLGGLISNLEAAPQRFLMQLGIEKMSGIQSLMGFMKKLLEYFDLANPKGQALAKTAGRLVETLFGGLDKIKDDDLARFFEAGLKVAEKFADVIKSAWEWLDQMLHSDTSALVAATGKAMLEVGKLLGQGIWEGFKLAFSGKEEADKKRYGGMTEGQYNALGKELGEQAVRKGEIDAEIIRRGGGAEGAGTRALVEYLDKRGGLPDALAGQVSSAKEHYNPGDYQGMDPDKAAEMAAEAQEIMKRVGEDAAEGLEGGARKKLRSHSPSMAMDEVGVDAVDGLLQGVKRRIAQLREGGMDDELDPLINLLRQSAARVGAPAR